MQEFAEALFRLPSALLAYVTGTRQPCARHTQFFHRQEQSFVLLMLLPVVAVAPAVTPDPLMLHLLLLAAAAAASFLLLPKHLILLQLLPDVGCF
jgi:hypothetical protein